MPFANLSAMDGIVVNKKNLSINKKYTVIGESKSGDIIAPDIKNSECILTYTGAPVPKGKNIIIPKENCEYLNKKKIVQVKEILMENLLEEKVVILKKMI